MWDWALNIGWHEHPERTIKSYVELACLFTPKLGNQTGDVEASEQISRPGKGDADEDCARICEASWNVAGTSFCGPFGPWSVQVSAFVHGVEMADIRHFCKFRVPALDSNL